LTHKALFNPSFALVSGVLGVSSGAIFVRLADAPALVTAAYRVGLAAVIFIPVIWWKTKDQFWRLSWRDLGTTVLAGFFLALHFAAWISSLDYTSIANSVVLVNTTPVWVGLLTPFLTQDRISRRTVKGIILSISGGALIGAEELAMGGRAWFGDLLALSGSFCAAGYLLLGRNLRRNLGLLSYTLPCYGSAAVFLWFMVIVAQLPYSGFNTHTWAAFLGMAICAQIIGHTSYNYALKWFSANLIAVSLLGEPVLATFMGWILFQEGLTWIKLAGGVLILMGIYLAASGETTKD
jgi:drug/metabolite transporter (DMT)-like permease